MRNGLFILLFFIVKIGTAQQVTPCEIDSLIYTKDTDNGTLTVRGRVKLSSSQFIWIFGYSSGEDIITSDPTSISEDGTWELTIGKSKCINRLVILVVDTNTNSKLCKDQLGSKLFPPNSLCNKEIKILN